MAGAVSQCPLWVKSRHSTTSQRCPLYPQKRTWLGAVAMSVKCQKRTLARLRHVRSEADRRKLHAGTRHEAANSCGAVAFLIGPYHGRAETVGLWSRQAPQTISTNADTIMALLCVPIDILQTDTIGKGAAQSVSTCKAVEPFLEGVNLRSGRRHVRINGLERTQWCTPRRPPR